MIKTQLNKSIKTDNSQHFSSDKPIKNPLLVFALRYAKLGWSVIPLKERSKEPFIKWAPNQHTRADEEQIKSWWEEWPNANIGIVTGAISGIVVLDADSKKARDYIKKNGSHLTPVSSTHKGRHIYYKHPGKRVANKTNHNLGLDVRGDGGYIVAPPSIHPNGDEYEWKLSPWDRETAELPGWTKDFDSKPKTENIEKYNQPGWAETALNGVKEGGRNQMATRLVGHYFALGMRDSEIASLLLMWNLRNRPPLPSQEIHRTVASVRATHERNHSNPKVFPTVMSGLAGDFAKLYAEHLEAPTHFFYMAFLTCLGTALARVITLNIQIAPQPRMYTILLGESADVRKSTVLKEVTEFFEAAIPEDDFEMNIAGVGFDICRGVGSAEGLQKRLSQNPRVLLCLDEFKQFVGKSRIDNSVLLPCVNTLFENNCYENQTKKSRISLDNAYLSLLAASTTDTWDQVLSSAFTAIGFCNRLFLVSGSGERKYPLPPKVPEDERGNLMRRLQNMVLNFETRKEFEISQEGNEIFEQWYLNLPPSVHSKRLDTYALRLMPLLAVNDNKEEVDENTVEKAIALCDWQLQVRQLYDPIDANNQMAKMEEKIRRVLKSGSKTERELKQGTNYTRSGLWYFETAMKNLERNGEIRKTRAKSKIWELK